MPETVPLTPFSTDCTGLVVVVVVVVVELGAGFFEPVVVDFLLDFFEPVARQILAPLEPVLTETPPALPSGTVSVVEGTPGRLTPAGVDTQVEELFGFEPAVPPEPTGRGAFSAEPERPEVALLASSDGDRRLLGRAAASGAKAAWRALAR
jgi:hypothetical protein